MGLFFGLIPLAATLVLSEPGLPSDAYASETGKGQLPSVVARILPAVVSITTRQIERDQFNQPVPTRGLGSGVIVDREGHILTNSHVVEGAEEIKVTLPVGVVSALRRSMEQPGLPMLHDLIQTDAAINAGNSGGPLVNLAGQVVGINTAVIESAHGIGFAISANTARPVLRQLIASGRIVRPSLGLDAVSLTPQVAYANNLPIERGALVTRVESGGPAEGAGLRPGDVVTVVDGQPVRDLHHLHESLGRRRVGETVEMAVWREGATLVLRAVLGGEP